MPPYRTGLLKRKLGKESLSPNTEKEPGIVGEPIDELIAGPIAVEDVEDPSESENDQLDDASSNSGLDEVLFGDNDEDSLVDERNSLENISDESSELTDSEEESDNSNGSEEDCKSNQDEKTDDSVDSGAESGTHLPHSDSSEEAKSDKQWDRTDKVKKKTRKKKSMSKIDILANKMKETTVDTQPVGHKDEYESGDTSDEEDRRNTVGEVPMWWYNEYPHVGYDLDGRRIIRPPQRDQIDEFLKKCEDPEFWRTVRDPSTGQDVLLSTADLQLLARLKARATPTDHDDYQPWTEWFTREVLATPVRGFPEHKRSFLPSREEQRAVGRLVHALRAGWLASSRQRALARKQSKERKFYNLWASAGGDGEGGDGGEGRARRHIPAPRRPPPSHAESYNPPPEYLLDKHELKQWESLSTTPWKRKYTFLPTAHSALRAVPAYPRYVRERFLRCLDLYLAPRAVRLRLTATPTSLLPQLPAPRDLQPFPTQRALSLAGHSAAVRSLDFDSSGQYLATGADDNTVKVWETSTGRCVHTVQLEAAAVCVRWAAGGALWLLAVCAGERLLLVNPAPAGGRTRVADRTDELLGVPPAQHDQPDPRALAAATWEPLTAESSARGVRASVRHAGPLRSVAWHARADYLCVTAGGVTAGTARSLLVHQVSRRRSHLPLTRVRGHVQCALFHPHKPQLFVATQRAVRIYDLVKQELVKKLTPGVQWISDLAIHPRGDNLLVASYDRKVAWFDLELGSSPYSTLRLHGRAVRSVACHPRYPLFATAGDDRYAVVSHGMVYSDLLQNPLIVPLKQLPVEMGGAREADEAGEVSEAESMVRVLEARWHPAQPWLALALADGTVALYA